jgi:hypothetical protein
LHRLAIQNRLDAQIVRVGNFISRHQYRAEGAECVERLATASLAATARFLPIASAHVIGAGVPNHVTERALEFG